MENFFIFRPLEVSIAPPLAFLAFFYVTFYRNYLFVRSTSLLVIVFLVYALAISFLLMCISFSYQMAPIGLAKDFVKQSTSLVMGVISFFAIRSIFVAYGYKVFFWIALGGIPAIFISMIHIFGYSMGMIELVEAIDKIRILVLGEHISSGYQKGAYILTARVSGFTVEAAHFGAYLSLILMPSIVVALSNHSTGQTARLLLKLLFVFATICLVFTFSMTTISILLAMIVVFFSMRQNFSIKKISIFVIVTCCFLAIFVLIPTNYVIHHFFFIQKGDLSWVGKFGGSVGPLYMISETANFWGYGLGANNTYIHKVLPQMFIDWQAIWAKDSDYIKTLFGRIIADLGIIGLIMFLGIFLISYKLSKRLDPKIGFIIPALLVGVLVAVFNGNVGSYSHPFVWFWPAFVEAACRMHKKGKLLSN